MTHDLKRTPKTRVVTAFLVMIGSLLLGSLLNARALATTANTQSPGLVRTVMIPVTDALVRVSTALWLDRPRQVIDSIVGGSTSNGDPGSVRPVFLPTPNRPALMLVAGDSLVDPFGPEMVTTATDTGVIRGRWEIRYSSGLTRPQIFDWSQFFEEELARSPADIVVFMVGANDSAPIETEAGWVSTNTDEWADEYQRRVEALMDELSGMAATVYWVGQPIARSEEHSERMAALNAIYRSAAGNREGVRYVDAWEVFTNTEGEYTDFLPDERGRMVLMRQPDGIHLTPEGGRRLARVVLEAIRLDWTVER